jgi:hypothetical protein
VRQRGIELPPRWGAFDRAEFQINDSKRNGRPRVSRAAVSLRFGCGGPLCRIAYAEMAGDPSRRVSRGTWTGGRAEPTVLAPSPSPTSAESA